MKMFKRLAAVLLAGVMVLAMLTACGGGTAEASFEDKVQSKYLAALNDAFGTHLSNDSEVKELAETALNNIKDGKISSNDGVLRSYNDQKYIGVMVCVEEMNTSKALYTAISYDETTAQTITVDEASVKYQATVVNSIIESGKQAGTKIELAGLGVATKTIDSKTYVAVGFKLTK